MKKILFVLFLAITPAFAVQHTNPLLVIDVESGEVLQEQEAGTSWYPASLTKMMNTYTVLSAIKQGRLTLDHPIRVSQKATRQAPAKMGFKAGTIITVHNALKIIMVKSANDVSYTLAEGVSGSLENFVKEMNSNAQKLGMSGTHFINANGLPGRGQMTTARDMAVLGRALLIEFPEMADLFDIPSIQYGTKNIRNTNHLIGRYPNVTGIKTGFICASGFNVVASVQKNGRYLISVVLGAKSARERAMLAAASFDKYGGGGTHKNVLAIQNEGGAPQDIRAQICRARVKGGAPVAETGEDFEAEPTPLNGASESSSDFFRREAMRNERPVTASLLSTYAPTRSPEPIFLGAKTGVNLPILGAAEASKKESTKKLAAVIPTATPVPTVKKVTASKTTPVTKKIQPVQESLKTKPEKLKTEKIKLVKAKKENTQTKQVKINAPSPQEKSKAETVSLRKTKLVQ